MICGGAQRMLLLSIYNIREARYIVAQLQDSGKIKTFKIRVNVIVDGSKFMKQSTIKIQLELGLEAMRRLKAALRRTRNKNPGWATLNLWR